MRSVILQMKLAFSLKFFILEGAEEAMARFLGQLEL